MRRVRGNDLRSHALPRLTNRRFDEFAPPRMGYSRCPNAVKWRWDFFGNAFGENAPTMPAGGVALNMRYPGQLF